MRASETNFEGAVQVIVQTDCGLALRYLPKRESVEPKSGEPHATSNLTMLQQEARADAYGRPARADGEFLTAKDRKERKMSNEKYKAKLEHYDSDEAVRDALEKQLSELWNRVEDRMPKDGKIVLVYFEDFSSDIAWYDKQADCWISYNDVGLDNVTHWMKIIPPTSSL
jgi:hypothetical protein